MRFLGLLLILLNPLWSNANGQMMPFGFWTVPSAGPAFIQEVQTIWSTLTDKTTSSFNVKAGDILVVYVGMEHAHGAMPTVSGGSLTWTLRQIAHTDLNSSSAGVWTATVDADKSMTVSVDTPNTQNFGLNVLTFRGSSGVGASSVADAVAGAPSLNITTTKANSAIVVLSVDWNAGDGASRTWRTNAGALSELTYYYESSRYTAYAGYHPNSGPIGTYAVGLSAPAGQKFSIVALEIKGP